ncbi:MAG: hypothetical protein AB7Q00_02145 [Phycisphaerales bacterium]
MGMVMVASACIGCHSFPDDPPPLTRVINIDVAVTTSTSNAVEDVVVGVFRASPMNVAKTNAGGHASLTVTVPEMASRVFVGLKERSTPLVQEGTGIEWAKFFETVDSNNYEWAYEIPLTTSTEYSLTIAGSPSVSVQGEVAWGIVPEQKVYSIIVSHWARGIQRFTCGEPFDLKGVRQGMPSRLFVLSSDRDRMVSVPLTAAQTASNVELGTFSGPESSEGWRVSIVMSGWQSMGSMYDAAEDRASTAVIVRSDGAYIAAGSYQLHNVDTARKIESSEHSDGYFRLPIGTYFVVPGIPTGKAVLRVLDLIAAGRVNDLLSSSATRVVVPEGNEGEPLLVNLDAPACEAAILAIP